MPQAITLIRTFTATDDCGNSSSATQTITVEDTTAPEFTSVPADYTIECSDDLVLDNATAEDNCNGADIQVTSEIVEGNATGNYTIVRTFTATDDAGNVTRRHKSSPSRTPRLLSSQVSLPTTPRSAPTNLCLRRFGPRQLQRCSHHGDERNHRWKCRRGTTRLFVRSLRRMTLATAALLRRPSQSRTRRRLNSTFLRISAQNAQTNWCSMTPRRRTTAERSPSTSQPQKKQEVVPARRPSHEPSRPGTMLATARQPPKRSRWWTQPVLN